LAVGSPGASAGNDESGQLLISSNLLLGSISNRYNNAPGGVGIMMDTRTSDTTEAFAVYTNLAGQNSVQATAKISMTQAGACAFGSTATNAVHTVRGVGASAGPFNTQISIVDDGNIGARATGSGGGLSFGGVQGDNGTYLHICCIKMEKVDANVSYGHNLCIYTTNQAGAGRAKVATFGSEGVCTFPVSVSTPVITSTAAITILPGTADGSDDKYVSLCGGGAGQAARGAIISIYGNEVATVGGRVEYIGGAGATGTAKSHVWYGGAAVTETGSITAAGAWTRGASSVANNHTDHGYVSINGGGTSGAATTEHPYLACKTIKGTTDGSGDLTIAHGISTGGARIAFVAMKNFLSGSRWTVASNSTVDYLTFDDTNIIYAGGTNSTAIEFFIYYEAA
jgi:hypothetical protein